MLAVRGADLELRVARAGDGVAGREVHLELAPVGALGHAVERQEGLVCVGAVGFLADVVVDREAGGAGVGDAAGAALVRGGGARDEEGGAEEGEGGGEVLHFGGLSFGSLGVGS